MITAQLIKELRDRTWVGMADCKNALVETNGDIEAAIESLRKKWIAKAAKRAENVTSEWKIKIVKSAAWVTVVAVACETDFVARNDSFDEMLTKFIEIRNSSSSDEDAVAKAEELKSTEYQLKIGENMRILALTEIKWDVVESYVHSNNKVASVVVAKAGTSTDDLKQVAMHVTASNPEVVRPSDISEDAVNKEKEIQLELMKNDPKNAGKPEDIMLKIIEGKMTKFKEENALNTQQFVINPDIKVQDFIGADSIISFKRIAI